MSILVLGGAGYIGLHAVYQLIDHQRDVVVVDDLSTGHQEAIHPRPHGGFKRYEIWGRFGKSSSWWVQEV